MLFLCARAEHSETFLQTFHSIAKFLEIVGDEERLHECRLQDDAIHVFQSVI